MDADRDKSQKVQALKVKPRAVRIASPRSPVTAIYKH